MPGATSPTTSRIWPVAGTRSSTPGRPSTSTPTPTCSPRSHTAAGTACGAWPRPRPMGCRRGAVPQHGPAFFRRGEPGGAAADARRDYERRWAGVKAHNRWLADFCAATPGRSAGPDHSGVRQPHRRRVSAEVRWAAGTFEPFGGILFRPSRPSRTSPAVGGPLRAAMGGLRRARRADQHPRGARCRLRGARVRPRHDAHRTALVQSPRRVAPDLLGRARAPPHAALRGDRAGRGLGSPRGLETLDWFYGRMTTAERGGGQLLRCCRGQAMTD